MEITTRFHDFLIFGEGFGYLLETQIQTLTLWIHADLFSLKDLKHFQRMPLRAASTVLKSTLQRQRPIFETELFS